MRLVLIQPPSNYEETFLLSPPLGLLSVGAAAENEGAEVTLLDFNLKGLQDQRWQTAEYFYPHAVELIEQSNPDIVGFTSMAIESHVCLETAKLLKERNPNIITIFGGPHFGAIATEVLENYTWTDYVISGEGEAPLQNLIRYLEGHDSVTTMDNIAYRDNGEIIFNRRSMSGRDLDELPFPAYHLVDIEEYFALNPNKLVCFEHARGCFLKCSFCYSPQHWGHGESRKSTERVLAELRQLKEMGIKELFWVSDNLLNSKDNAVSLCEAISKAELQFKWHCYGTTAQITEPVVQALSSAGCQSIFVGVDAVSDDNKKKYKKSYFKGWDGLREKLSLCLSNRITPTCAFMLSPLDSEDTRESTLRIAALCANLGCFVRLNALTYYNHTEIEAQVDLELDKEYSEAYAIVLFDTAEILIRNDYAQLMPELFPFHRTFTGKMEHDAFAGYCRVAMQVLNNHSLLVVIASTEYGLSIPDLVSSVNTSMGLENISCHGLKSPWNRLKVINSIHAYCHSNFISEEVRKIDFFSRSNYSEQRLIVLKVQGCDIPCIVSDYLLFESTLDLENQSFRQTSEVDKFILQRNAGRIEITRIESSVSQSLEAILAGENILMPTPEYRSLVSKRVLTPVL